MASDLETLLDAEIGTLDALAKLLDEEHQALLDNNAEALESVTQRKNTAIEAHQTQQQQRLHWMTGAALPVDTPLESLVAQAGNSARARELQTALTALAEDCQSRNRRNGGLIMRLQDRTRGALDVLRREESGNIYSLSGAREQSSDSRTLGKA